MGLQRASPWRIVLIVGFFKGNLSFRKRDFALCSSKILINLNKLILRKLLLRIFFFSYPPKQPTFLSKSRAFLDFFPFPALLLLCSASSPPASCCCFLLPYRSLPSLLCFLPSLAAAAAAASSSPTEVFLRAQKTT